MNQTNKRPDVQLLAFWCLDVKVLDYMDKKNKHIIHGHSFPGTPAFTKGERSNTFVFDECGLAVDFFNEPLWTEILRVFPVYLVVIDAPQICENNGLGRQSVARYLRL